MIICTNTVFIHAWNKYLLAPVTCCLRHWAYKKELNMNFLLSWNTYTSEGEQKTHKHTMSGRDVIKKKYNSIGSLLKRGQSISKIRPHNRLNSTECLMLYSNRKEVGQVPLGKCITITRKTYSTSCRRVESDFLGSNPSSITY